MMSRLIKAICVAVVFSATVHAQVCTDEAHCAVDFYCEVSVHFCSKCVSCEDFHREPPAFDTQCVKSVVKCGPCHKGLIEDVKFGSHCITPVSQENTLPLEWIAVVVCLLLLCIIICIAVTYLLKNFKSFNLFTSAGATIPTESPTLPPPYNAVALLSPPEYNHTQEEMLPIIKVEPNFAPLAPVVSDVQQARVFNEPIYHDEEVALPQRDTPEYRNNGLTTSNVDNTDADGETFAATSDFVEHPVNVRPAEHPTSKLPRIRQDSNNNGDENSESGAGTSYSSFTAQDSSPFIINVIKNVTTIQHNEGTSTSS